MNLVNQMKCENVDVLSFMKGDINIDVYWPTSLDLLDANPVHDNTEDDDENDVDVLDLLEEQWLMKGLKPQRDSIMDAFSNKDSFKEWVKEYYGNISKFVETLNDEIRILSVEAIQESIIGIKNMSIYPNPVYGERYEIYKKGKDALRTALNDHDEMVVIYFDEHLTKILSWGEDILDVKSFLLGDHYE